jgi:mannose-6-phosphate isomerase
MRNQVQHYAWGTRDAQAFIPRLLGIEPQPGLPYAELWMGTHANAPSSLLVNGNAVPLGDWITSYPQELLGAETAKQFSGRLPFLFKVLSAGEALSIQAHPNQAQAEALHARDPQNYPDKNHKPEIAVALDALTALMGIKPYPRFIEALQRYPEISAFIGTDAIQEMQKARLAPQPEQNGLTNLAFRRLIQRSITQSAEVNTSINRLFERLGNSATPLCEEERVFMELRGKYPGADVGLLAIFLLNLIHLEEGQGIYTHAGVPHAYLMGNIIECMANSDNVVRVGLTTKFKDAEALLEILAEGCEPVSILEGVPQAEEIIYPAPIQEFVVSRSRLTTGAERVFRPGGKAAVLLVTQGRLAIRWEEDMQPVIESFGAGQSLFIPAIMVQCHIQAQDQVEYFMAGVP